jgi:hypothetical protein
LFWAEIHENTIDYTFVHLYIQVYRHIYIEVSQKVGYSREYKGIPLNPPMVVEDLMERCDKEGRGGGGHGGGGGEE